MTPESSPPVRIASGSNRVTVLGEPRDDISVEGSATTDESDDELRIDATGRLTVRVPEGADVIVAAVSGRVTTHGRLGAVRIIGESGRVTVDRAREVDIRTRSAGVEIGSVDTTCTVRTGSGRIEVTRCGGATISTDSGRISVNGSTGPVTVHCISGRVAVAMDSAADVVAEAVSGRVTVSYPTGVRVRRVDDDATAAETGADDDADCCVLARSVSGRVEVSNR